MLYVGIFYDILSIEKVSAFVLSLLGDGCELEFGRLGILVLIGYWGLILLFSIPNPIEGEKHIYVFLLYVCDIFPV